MPWPETVPNNCAIPAIPAIPAILGGQVEKVASKDGFTALSRKPALGAEVESDGGAKTLITPLESAAY